MPLFDDDDDDDGLFGGGTPIAKPKATALGGLFGGDDDDNDDDVGGSVSLFGGASTAQPKAAALAGGLFGGGSGSDDDGETKQPIAATPGGGLFGGADDDDAVAGADSLFGGGGASANQPKAASLAGALFGGDGDDAEGPPSSLFGGGGTSAVGSLLSGSGMKTAEPSTAGLVASLFADEEPQFADSVDSLFDSDTQKQKLVMLDLVPTDGMDDIASSKHSSEHDDESSSDAGSSAPEVRYRVVDSEGAAVRANFDIMSTFVRTLPEGEVIEALDKKVNEKGVLRIHFADGWVSQMSSDGDKLLHWLGTAESDSGDSDNSEPEAEGQGEEKDLTTSMWEFFAPTHAAIAKLEKQQAAMGAVWMCSWCGCEEDGTPAKTAGPEGADTLCTACGVRYEETWTCDKCDCSRAETDGILPGPDAEDGTAQMYCAECGGDYAEEQAAERATVEAKQAQLRAEAAAARKLVEAAANAQREEDAALRAEQAAAARVRMEEAEAARMAADALQALRKRYRVVNGGVIRFGSSLTSPRADRAAVHVGEAIEVIEEIDDLASGQKRVKFADGWVSERSTDGTPILEPGTEWFRVVAPTPIRVGVSSTAESPPVVLQQTLSVGDIVKAREVVQDDDGYEPEEGEVPALHVRISVDRWVSEVDTEGNMLLEAIDTAERFQLEEAELTARAVAEKQERQRLQSELVAAKAAAQAQADADAQAREEAEWAERLAAAKAKQDSADATEVGEWLQKEGLSAYSVAFYEQGYEDLAVLKSVRIEEVDQVLQDVEMKVGHSFHFRDILTALQMEDSMAVAQLAQRELQAAVDKHIAPELAGIEAAERRLQAALEKVAAQQSGHTHELQRAVEAQDRIDQAELQTYRDTTAARKQRQQHASSRTAFEAAEAVVNRETVQERRAAVVLADVQRKHAAAEEHLRLEQTAVRTAQHATLLANNRQVAAKETTNSEAASKRVLEAEMVVLVGRAEVAARLAAQAADTKDIAEATAAAASEVAAKEEERREGAAALLGRSSLLMDCPPTPADDQEVHAATVSLVAAAAAGNETQLLTILGPRGGKLESRLLNSATPSGEVAVSAAAMHGHSRCVDALINRGADFELMPMNHWTVAMVQRWLCRRFRWGERYRSGLAEQQVDGQLLAGMQGDAPALQRALASCQPPLLWSHADLLAKALREHSLVDGNRAAAALARTESTLHQLEDEQTERTEAGRRAEAAAAQADKLLATAQVEARWRDAAALAERKIVERTQQEAVAAAAVGPSLRGAHMMLFVKAPTGQTHRLEAWSGERVADLKARVACATGIATTQQVLKCQLRELNDNMSLSASRVGDGSVVSVSRLFGGGRQNKILRALKS